MKRRGLEPGAHRQWHGYTYERLREHRVKELRVEARAAQLAVAFLRGRPYLSVEQKVREPIDPGSKFAQKLHDLIWRFAVTGTRAEYDFGATGNAPSSTFLMQAVKSWLARPITAK